MTDIAGERSRLRAVGFHHEYREAWGARQAYTSDRGVDRPARWLFLHIAVITVPARTPEAERKAMRLIESIGQSRFGIGCSYNEAACQSGRLYELQPLGRRGAHTVNDLVNPRFPAGSLNRPARALVLSQNVGDEVTDAQVDAAARWGAACVLAGEAVPGAEWFGHRDVTQKSCPGPVGYARLGELNRLTAHYVAVGLGATPAPPPQEDDMPLTAAEKAEIAGLVLDGMAHRIDPDAPNLRHAVGNVVGGQVKLRLDEDRRAEPFIAWAGDGPVYLVDGHQQSKRVIHGWANVAVAVNLFGVHAPGTMERHGEVVPQPYELEASYLDDIPTVNAAPEPAEPAEPPA